MWCNQIVSRLFLSNNNTYLPSMLSLSKQPPGASYHHLMHSDKVQCLKLDRRNQRFYTSLVSGSTLKPTSHHLCLSSKEIPKYLSSLPWSSCHVLTCSPAAAAAAHSTGRPWILWQFHARSDCCPDVLNWSRWNSQHVSTHAVSDSAVYMDRFLHLV